MVGASYFFILAATLVVLVNAQTKDYCNVQGCHKGAHTLCVYRNKGPGSACGKVIKKGLNQDEIDEIVNYHNKLRAYVASGQEKRGSNGPQPRAKNMPPLQWSDELAKIAQTWVDQCNYGHDACRNTDKWWVGQNAAKATLPMKWPSQGLTPKITRWYDEVQNFNKNLVPHFVNRPSPPITGHYTQMLWAKTTHIGCGYIIFNNNGKDNIEFLVCNYGPSGNYDNKPMYETA